MFEQDHRKGIHWRRWVGDRPRGSVFHIHGLGESGLCFETLIQHPKLAGWNHYVPDLPGFGKSPSLAAPASLDDYATLVGRLIHENCRAPVSLVGHSMGGALGQLVCEANPELLDGFVNVEGNLSLDDCVFSGQAAAAPLGDFLAGGFERLADGVCQDGLEDPPQRGYYASLRLCDRKQFYASSRELVELSAGETLARRFAGLPLRAKLFVAGLKGGAGSRSLDLLRQAGAPWVGFEASGHWPFLSEGDRFAGMLRDFLAGVEDVGGAPDPRPQTETAASGDDS